MLMAINIQKYNPEWKAKFEKLREYLLSHFANNDLTIEHVGSTSVPGMSAKPIIDIDLIIENNNEILKKVINKLENLGYTHLGEMGISGREAFKRNSLKTPTTENGKEWFEHNLYVCKKGSIGLNNHLTLKKHLLNNPEKVIEYSELKQKLVEKFPNDIDSYVDGKTDFIIDILKKEGINSSETELIENENKKPTHNNGYK